MVRARSPGLRRLEAQSGAAPRSAWVPVLMAKGLADTESIAFMVSRPQATIRSWAHRGDLKRRGTGPHGRALYDVDEALELATKRATLDNTSTRRNTQLPAGPVRPPTGDGALRMPGGGHDQHPRQAPPRRSGADPRRRRAAGRCGVRPRRRSPAGRCGARVHRTRASMALSSGHGCTDAGSVNLRSGLLHRRADHERAPLPQTHRPLVVTMPARVRWRGTTTQRGY